MSRFLKPTLLTATALMFAAPALASSPAELFDLGAQVRDVKSFIESGLTRENCAAEMARINASTDDLNPKVVMIERAKAEAKDIIKTLFLTRVALNERLKDMSAGAPVDPTCMTQLRRSVRISRYLEEYLGKIAGFDQKVDVLKGTEPYVLVNPKFGSMEVKTGDILISRGDAVVSAAIARIGDDDSQFSHASIVYVDEKTAKTYVIEAHIETGTDAAPIEKKYETDGKLRAVIYRPRDPELAARAGKYAYDTAMKALKNKKPIPYDFGMVLDDESELFCSEIPYAAYKHVSGGQFILGDQYRTTFNMKNKSFLRGLGVKVSETFAPSDVEFDTKLELVGEWRAFGSVERAARADAVMNKIFAWMDEGYDLDTSETVFKAHFAYLARMFGFLKKKLADNMGPTSIKHVLAMDALGNKVVEKLTAAYSSRAKIQGYPPTFNEMLPMLEKIRAEDRAREQRQKDWYRQFVSEDPSTKPEGPHFLGLLKRKSN